MKREILMKRIFAVALILVLAVSLLAGCGGSKDDATTTERATRAQSNSDSRADTSDETNARGSSTTAGNAIIGTWTAYATRISEEYEWEDIKFFGDKGMSLELLEDGSIYVVRDGTEEDTEYAKWEENENGFELSHSIFGNMGNGVVDDNLLIISYGFTGLSMDYKMVKGDIDAALTMMRDDVNKDAYVGIWELTDFRDWEGNMAKGGTHIYKDGLIVDIKANGDFTIYDVKTLSYSDPKEFEWTLDSGYLRCKDEYSEYTGSFKNGVFQIDLGGWNGIGYFVKNPNALDELFSSDGDESVFGIELDGDVTAGNSGAVVGAGSAIGASGDVTGRYDVVYLMTEDGTYDASTLAGLGLGEIYMEVYDDQTFLFYFGGEEYGTYAMDGDDILLTDDSGETVPGVFVDDFLTLESEGSIFVFTKS